MAKDVVLLTGAGEIGIAIARRISYDKIILMGSRTPSKTEDKANMLRAAGFTVETTQLDLGNKESIDAFVKKGLELGEIANLINAAGVSPSQSPIKTILQVDLYGTAYLLQEVGKVIKEGGTGVTISSQSGYRMEQLGAKKDKQLAMTPCDELLDLDFLQEENIKNTLHAYQLAKRCNGKRVMYEAVQWGKRKARINSISPGIVVTPLAIDEFNGIRGDFYKNMFAKCPAGRPASPDEIAALAELIMGPAGAFITGSDFLIDGGATASYFYGPLNPENEEGIAEGDQ